MTSPLQFPYYCTVCSEIEMSCQKITVFEPNSGYFYNPRSSSIYELLNYSNLAFVCKIAEIQCFLLFLCKMRYFDVFRLLHGIKNLVRCPKHNTDAIKCRTNDLVLTCILWTFALMRCGYLTWRNRMANECSIASVWFGSIGFDYERSLWKNEKYSIIRKRDFSSQGTFLESRAAY